MEILAHQKEQIDTLALGIKAATDTKIENENKMVAEALAAIEAKKTLDDKYHKKHAKAMKKLKQKERRKRKKFAEELQYYNLMYNNPYGGIGGMPPMRPGPF